MEGFNPERFKAGASYGEVDLHGAHFELLPFSAGRRICPGIAMALMNLEFTLANLLFHVGAGSVAPHYIPPPSTFNVLLDSYWFD
ncbi:hypothetical protein QYE76_056168 [Lolium multiflorum]|uniref:Cytochrome P450 n=1 Tax=Lolium multiflorum TaxID=4521 RepID=A0AAD8T268_LOLMU|nr:hypothetical protein QYE76_056168 [Lolium multiflorum]